MVLGNNNGKCGDFTFKIHIIITTLLHLPENTDRSSSVTKQNEKRQRGAMKGQLKNINVEV